MPLGSKKRQPNRTVVLTVCSTGPWESRAPFQRGHWWEPCPYSLPDATGFLTVLTLAATVGEAAGPLAGSGYTPRRTVPLHCPPRAQFKNTRSPSECPWAAGPWMCSSPALRPRLWNLPCEETGSAHKASPGKALLWGAASATSRLAWKDAWQTQRDDSDVAVSQTFSQKWMKWARHFKGNSCHCLWPSLWAEAAPRVHFWWDGGGDNRHDFQYWTRRGAASARSLTWSATALTNDQNHTRARDSSREHGLDFNSRGKSRGCLTLHCN